MDRPRLTGMAMTGSLLARCTEDGFVSLWVDLLRIGSLALLLLLLLSPPPAMSLRRLFNVLAPPFFILEIRSAAFGFGDWGSSSNGSEVRSADGFVLKD